MYDINKLKPLPEGFMDWIEENIPKEPIFYKNHRKTSDLTCGYCGGKSTIYFASDEDIFELGWSKPIRYNEAVCPLCMHRSYYENGHVSAEHRGEVFFSLIQQDTDKNLVLRIYRADWAFLKGVEANHDIKEIERYILIPGRIIKFKLEYDYGTGKYELKECVHGRFSFDQRSLIFDGIKDFDLAWEVRTSNFGYYDADLYEPIFASSYYNYDFAYSFMKGLVMFANAPWTESFLKMGWSYIVRDLMHKDGTTKHINKKAKSLKKQLRLKSGNNIRLFREVMEENPERWRRSLELLQLSEKNKKQYTFEELQLFNQHYSTDDIQFMLKYMTIKQLINRIQEYKKANKKMISDYSVFIEYRDYLRLREELGYDMANEVYRHPKDLYAKHQALIEEKRLKTENSRITAMNEKYKAMQKLYEELRKKYCYEAGGFIIRPAKNAAELIKESKILHHCVGSSETYMSKHASQKSFILFLRKKEHLNTPFCTIEISGPKDSFNKEPRILQWYEAYDKKPDEEILQPIIDEYVGHIKETLAAGRKRASA